jgi:hypothetical protein
MYFSCSDWLDSACSAGNSNALANRRFQIGRFQSLIAVVGIVYLFVLPEIDIVWLEIDIDFFHALFIRAIVHIEFAIHDISARLILRYSWPMRLP